MTGFELMHVSNLACGLVTFLLNVVLIVAAWLIVLTTVDRFVAVWLPLRAVAVCRRRRARVAVLVLIIIVIITSVHLFWTSGLYHNSRTKLIFCGPPPTAYFMRREFYYIKLASYSLVPFAIILILNVAIVVRLRCGKAASMVLRSSSGHSGALQPAMTSKVTYMLLAVSATWLVLSGPFTIYMFVLALVDINNALSLARYRLFRTICFQLMYANHAVNFFLYCVTGRKFRRELRDMCSELCCGCRAFDDRCSGGRWAVGGDGATSAADCGNKMIHGGTPEAMSSASRHGRIGHELAPITTCRSTVAVHSSPTGQCATTSL